MLELIILLSILMVALSVGMLLLKFVFAMVLLPFKLVFFLTKGLLALVFVVPLMLILGVVLLITNSGPRYAYDDQEDEYELYNETEDRAHLPG